MDEALGKRIQRLRGNDSRAEFARRFEISPSSLVRWEKGEHPPDLNFLSKLTKIYDVTFEWLVDGQGEGPEAHAGTANLLVKTGGTDTQQLEITDSVPGRAAYVSSSESSAVAMLRREVEQLNQEIARLFADKREMGRELREALLELDQKSARIEQLEGELERLRQGGNA